MALPTIPEGGFSVHDLAQPLYRGMPSSPNHPEFHLSLVRRHGDRVREDGSSSASELMVSGTHTGTHVDAPAHISVSGRLHGGIPVEEAMQEGRFAVHGIDRVEPIVGRGILFDVPRALGLEYLAPAVEVTAEHLAEAARNSGIDPRPGDVALIRTGWGRHFSEPETYGGRETGVPGPGPDAVRWLLDRGIRATGGDTMAYELIPPRRGHALLPVHRLLLVVAGIPIIESLNLESLADSRISEFLFILAPLNILGATGSPVRPLAVTS